jgi:hypothetical protein
MQADGSYVFTELSRRNRESNLSQFGEQFRGQKVHLPVIEQCRQLFRKISVPHEPAGVGITFHSMILNQLYAFFGGFAEVVHRTGRHGDNGALRGRLEIK